MKSVSRKHIVKKLNKNKSHKIKSHTKKNNKYNHKHKSISSTENNIKIYKNDSGTRLLVLPNRNETATSSIYFNFKVGSKNEQPETNGISHFIEHMVFKGSPKFPNYLDISKTFDANGISFNAYTSKDTTSYHYKFLSSTENLDIICKITSDMIMNPLMREKEINTERNVIIQEYNDDIDDIDSYIEDMIEKCLLEGHSLGRTIIGTLKTIKDINRKELIEYHKKYYTPDNLVISFSGKQSNDYYPVITNYFGGAKSYKPININEINPVEIIPFEDKHPNFKIDCFPKDLAQDYIHIIFKTKGYYDPMRIQHKLLMNILGGNMSSRLFVEIREKMGLVYSIKCDITTYEELGYFDIYTQNEPKDTIKCIEAIFKELVKIKEHLVGETELKENKKNYCDIYKTNFDDIEYENEHYSRQILTRRPFETLKMRIDNIQNITSLDIQNVAKELFNFNKIHIITFGKIKKNKIAKVCNKFIK